LYGDETDLKSGYKEEISSKVDDNIQFWNILQESVRKCRLSYIIR
jgi:hypothetical protein